MRGVMQATKDYLMFDCKNIEEVKLATAGSSCCVAAAKRRGPLAFLVAVIIIAAALLFAMPSLAYADEASGSQEASPTQEILLSQKESSTSVSKAPDTSSAQPPAYSQQDAFNSASEQSSGVASVSGANASGEGSYTAGDDKSSSDSKDSDDDSDSDSDKTYGYPEGDSIINNNDMNSNDSTADNSGASSGSNTDELATGDSNNQSAQPTGDSKTDDVIATPGDQGSADQTAGADSDNAGEVQVGQTASNTVVVGPSVPEGFVYNTAVQTQATAVTPQANGPATYTIQFHFNQGFSTTPSGAYVDQPLPDVTFGNAQDPIFDNSGSWIAYAGDNYSVNTLVGETSFPLDKVTSSTVYNIRYGYTFTQWVIIAKLVDTPTSGTSAGKPWQKVTSSTTKALSTLTNYKNGKYCEIHAYPLLVVKTTTVTFYNGSTGAAYTGTYANATANYNTEMPFPEHTGTNNQWLCENNLTGSSKIIATEPVTEGQNVGDFMNSIYKWRGTTAAFDASKWGVVNVKESENVTDFKIDFTVGDYTGKVTVAGTTIKVSNNGTTKPTAAQVTAAGASATDSNKNDGWVLDGTKWKYTMGSTTGTLNSLADLANLTITANCVVSPVLKENTYTVVLNGGKAAGQTGFTNGTVSTSPINYKTAVNFTDASWNGYKFLGWSKTQQASIGTALAASAKIASGTAFNTISGANEDTASVTLYAWWEANKITITYNINAGTGSTQVPSGVAPSAPTAGSVDYNGTYTITTTVPTANGYTFDGWYTAASGGTKYGATISNVIEAKTLYAQWKVKTGYKVTFKGANGTTAVTNNFNQIENLKWTDTFSVPSTGPTAPAGYSFGGWYTAATGGTQVTAGTKTYSTQAVNDTVTEYILYARWTELGKLTFTMDMNAGGDTSVSYNGNTNGQNYSNNQVLNGGTASIPTAANPTRTGYTFKGWSESTNGTVNASYYAGATVGPLTANKTIYAIWEAAKITINYKQSASGDLTGVTNKKTNASDYTTTVNYGSTYAVPAGSTMYERAGYSFGSWQPGAGKSTVAAAGGNLVINTTNMVISFSTAANGTVTGTATIYPNWTSINYNIVWNLNGASGSIANTTNKKADETITLPTQPTRAGYTFQGWNTASAGTGTAVTNGARIDSVWTGSALPTTGGNLNAYAIWKENIVEIKFIGDNNSADKANVSLAGDSTTVNSGKVIYVGAATGDIYTTAAGTTKSGKNVSAGVRPEIVNTNYQWMVYSSGTDATYTSKWTVGSRTGAAASTVNTSTGVLTIAKNASTGLYTAADYYLTVSPKKITYTIEYYQQNVDDNNYTKVSGTPNTGTHFFGQTVTGGTTAGTSGTILTVVPATFTGFKTWQATASTNTVDTITIGATAANNVLKFYYDRNTYTLTTQYTGNKPTGLANPAGAGTYRYGKSITISAPAAVSGYTFSGWSANPTTTGVSGKGNITFTMPASNLTVTGTWGLETFNVTFKAANGSSLNTTGSNGAASQTLSFGASLTAIPACTVASTANYFMGWRIYTNCTTVGNEGTGTAGRVYTPEEILGTGAYSGNPWTMPSGNVTFVSVIMPVKTVSWAAGTGGAFATANGAISGQTVTSGGTYYSNITDKTNSDGSTTVMKLPQFMYSGHIDTSTNTVVTAGTKNSAATGWQQNAAGDTRNQYNPKAADGYKFTGWTWKDTLNNVTKTIKGHYNAAGVFVKESGDDLPLEVNQSYTFNAIFEKTWQQLHFVNTSVDGLGLTGGAAPSDVEAVMGTSINLPTSANYTAQGKPAGAYTLKGWTTDQTYGSGSPLYVSSFTMTAGTMSQYVYTMSKAAADGGYGVTLYPVFAENSVTITYALGTGMANMGTISKNSESVKMDTGTATGSTATAKTGYTFKGWYTNAAGTGTAVSTTAAFVPAKAGTPAAYAAATYYAIFEAETYTYTFKVGDHGTWTDPAGGTTDKTATVTFGGTVGAANVPATKAATGYGFQHWLGSDGKTYTAGTLAAKAINTVGPMTFTAIWEVRDGFTLVFETNGGAPSIANKTMQWTGSIATAVASTTAANMKRQGYTFNGWYAKSDFSADSLISTALNCAGATDTFQSGIAKSGQTIGADDTTATLTLYAKWTPNNYTITYDPKWPATNSTTYPNKTNVTWTDTNLLPAGADTLSMDGYTFTGWLAKDNGKTYTVTNTTKLSDIYVALYGSADYSTTKTIPLEAQWGTKTYTVKFVDPSGAVKKTESGKKWEDTIAMYTYDPGTAKRLVGWKYTPVGGSEVTWTSGSKTVSAIGGDASQATNGREYIVTAILEDNTKYEIHFYKVNLDATGNANVSGATEVSGSSKSGYATPGVAIDIKNFAPVGQNNPQNWIDSFETTYKNQLTGYAKDETVTGTKIAAAVAEVTAGSTIIFKVYYVEKKFNIEYDLGVTAIGAKPYAGSDPAPAAKTAGWNSSNILPDTTPTWEGYKAPKWQYKNASGAWVNVPAGATVSSIALSDDNTKTITLRALWDTDQVRLTYAVQVGGSIKSTDNALSKTGAGSVYEDIDAVNGTPKTMVATAASGYIFVGWYKDNVELTTNASYTAVKGDDGLFSTAVYEARFRALGSISYTIEHYFEQLDGTWKHETSYDDTRTGQEFAAIALTNDMKKTVKGFTWKSGITGSIESIASLTDGAVMKLYYERNEFAVKVQPSGVGADAPTPVPTPSYAGVSPDGIYQANTTQKYGASLVLPTMDAVNGWAFEWTVIYTEPGSNKTTTTLANGAPFTMVNAAVDIIGTWKRLTHDVTFTAGDDPHGTVVAAAGKTFPFAVTHGMPLGDTASTGTYADVVVTPADKWALSGWSYVDADGNAHTTKDPNSVVINCDTIFKALWAQTFYVAYQPGAHGGTGFTGQITAGDEIPADAHKMTSEYPLVIGGTNYATTNYANVPAAAGYRFVGWTWTVGGNTEYWIAPHASGFDTTGLTGTAGNMDFDVQNNVTFVALWEALEQTLTYKLEATAPASLWTATGIPGQNGLTTEDYVVNPRPRTDETVTLLTSADVARDGWSFVGWAVLNADGTKGSTITGTMKMPANAVTLVPVWEFEGLKIKFEIAAESAGRGSISKTYVDISDANASTLDGAVATAGSGYTFDGWYSDSACTNKVAASWTDIVAGGVQFIGSRPDAGWVPATYYAKFVPGYAGYTIEFYLQNQDGSYNETPSAVSATYTGPHTDVLTDDYADVTDPANPAYSHLLDTTVAPYKGYTFDQTVYGSVFMDVVMGDGSTVLKLYYKRTPFEIAYDKDTTGWTWVSTVGPIEAIADNSVSLPAAQREGFTHIGWTITDMSGNTIADIDTDGSFTMPQGDVLATAKWVKWVPLVIEYYTVDNPGVKICDDDVIGAKGMVGDPVTAPAEYINAHRPNGYTNPSHVETIILQDFAEGEDNPNVIKVIYQLVADYVLNFDPNGGIGGGTMADLTLRDVPANRLGEITTPTRVGFVLGDMPVRWNTKADGSGSWLTEASTFAEIAAAYYGDGFDDLTNKVVTLYAIWAENANYMVEYDLNNDPTVNKKLYDKVVGYWRNPVTPEDIKVTGVRWTQSGFASHTDETLDAAPAGFKFAGWNTKADGTGLQINNLTEYRQISEAIEPGAELMSVKLYAQWEEIFIEIEYIYERGGTITREIDRVSAATGQHVGEGSSGGTRLHSVATAINGYKFVGWYEYNSNESGEVRPMSARALESQINEWHTTGNNDNEIVVHEPGTDGRLYAATYIAKFALNDEAAINYDPNGGTGSITATKMPYGLTGTLSDGKGFTYKGWTLKGWNTAADGTGTAYSLGQKIEFPEGGMNLYAQWEQNKYDVKVLSRDDEIGKVIGGNTKLTIGEPLPPEFIAAISATAKPNSSFKGWRYTMVDAETGETHTGVVSDLSELTVMGPLTVEAEFDTQEPEYVSPVPKTGDTENGMLVLMMIAMAAMAAGIVMLLVARRREESDELQAESCERVREQREATADAQRAVACEQQQVAEDCERATREGATTADAQRAIACEHNNGAVSNKRATREQAEGTAASWRVAAVTTMDCERLREQAEEEQPRVASSREHDAATGGDAGMRTRSGGFGGEARGWRVRLAGGVCAAALAAICAAGGVCASPGTAVADTGSPSITSQSNNVSSDPATGSFQSYGGTTSRNGYVGSQSSNSASASSSSSSSAVTTPSSGATYTRSGYTGSSNASTSGNAGISYEKSGSAASSASSAVSSTGINYGVTQYDGYSTSRSGYTGSTNAAAASLASKGAAINTSAILTRSGFTGSANMDTEARSGYKGSFYFGNSKTLEEYLALSNVVATNASNGYSAATKTRAFVLSSLAHAGSKAGVAQARATYSRAVSSDFGMGGLYYSAAPSGVTAGNVPLTFASAGIEGKARDLTALGHLSLQETAQASDAVFLLDGLLDGTLTDEDIQELIASSQATDVTSTVEARNKWMLSMISPSANRLGAACLLADLAAAYDYSAGTLPLQSDDSAMVFPDLGEARLRDEDMVMGKLGLVPDIIGDTLNGTQSATPALLLDETDPRQIGRGHLSRFAETNSPGPFVSLLASSVDDTGNVPLSPMSSSDDNYAATSEMRNGDVAQFSFEAQNENWATSPFLISTAEDKLYGEGELPGDIEEPTTSTTGEGEQPGETVEPTTPTTGEGEQPGKTEEPVTPPVSEEPTEPVNPPVIEEKPSPRSYIINYDANGGKICDGSSSLQCTIVTDGANDILNSSDGVSKDGCTFLCWNTKSDGTGIAIKDCAAITSKNINDMIYDKDLANQHGADTTLYAQWVDEPVAGDDNSGTATTTPVDPIVDVTDPSVAEQPSQAATTTPAILYPGEIFTADTNSQTAATTRAQAPAAQSLRSSIAMAAAIPFVAAVNGASSIVDVMEGVIVPIINALQVSPVSTTQLVSLTPNQIAGVGDGEGGIGDMSTADVTVAVGTLAAAVSIAGITAAASGSVAASAAQSAVLTSAATSANAGIAGAASGAAGAAAADAAADVAALAAVSNGRKVRRFRRRHSVNK